MQLDLASISRSFAVFSFKSDLSARMRLWKKLGKQLRDDIPIITALQELRELRNPKEPTSIAIKEWIRAMENGKRFSEASREWVTPEEYMLLMAGEKSGALAVSLVSVTKVAMAKKNINSAVTSAVTYPIFLLLAAFGLAFLFSYKVIPAFAKSVGADRWHGLAKIFVDSATFTQNWMHWILLGLVLFVVLVIWLMPRWNSPFRTRLDRYVPFSVYRTMQGSAWLIALSALIQAGVRIEDALESLMANVPPWTRVRTAASLRLMRSGSNLGHALHKSGYEFPDREIISDLRVYSNKSGFGEALRMVSEEWITESVEKIQLLMKKVFFVSFLIASAVIAFEVGGLMAMQVQTMQLIQTK